MPTFGYQDAEAAAIATGNGLERNRNGGAGIRAIFALPALTGKFRHPAGGLVGGSGNLFPKTLKKLQRPDLIPEGTRTLNIIDVGRHLADDDVDPPIRGLVIYNHNPLIVHPDQNTMRRGLARDDVFTVVVDIAMTDSAVYADVVLPAASHFEHDEIYCAYGQQFLQRATPVIEPVGEALPNTEIFRRLARRFGFTDPMFQASDAELMDDAIDGGDPRLGGLRPSELPTTRALSMLPGVERIGFERRPTTRSGRIELRSAYLADKFQAPVPLYLPLAEDQAEGQSRGWITAPGISGIDCARDTSVSGSGSGGSAWWPTAPSTRLWTRAWPWAAAGRGLPVFGSRRPATRRCGKPT